MQVLITSCLNFIYVLSRNPWSRDFEKKSREISLDFFTYFPFILYFSSKISDCPQAPLFGVLGKEKMEKYKELLLS